MCKEFWSQQLIMILFFHILTFYPFLLPSPGFCLHFFGFGVWCYLRLRSVLYYFQFVLLSIQIQMWISTFQCGDSIVPHIRFSKYLSKSDYRILSLQWFFINRYRCMNTWTVNFQATENVGFIAISATKIKLFPGKCMRISQIHQVIVCDLHFDKRISEYSMDFGKLIYFLCKIDGVTASPSCVCAWPISRTSTNAWECYSGKAFKMLTIQIILSWIELLHCFNGIK